MHAIKTGRLGSVLSSGNNKFLIYSVNAALLFAIAAHAGLRVQDIFFTPDAVEAPQQKKIEIVRPKENFSLLPSLHLFGKAKDDAPGGVAKQEIIAPETKLALTLRGIFARRDKHTGIAIIFDDRGKDEKYFAVGAEVFGQATLKEIYDDRVILERNGKFETLRLPKEFLLREHFTNKALLAKRKEIATDYRKRFLGRDGMDLIKLFGFDTAYKNGSFIGFVIKALGDEGREMMEILGIMDGDLITVVNGLRFSESYDAFEELKKLKTATSVDVIIERDGVEIPFHFELEAPAEGEELDAYRLDDEEDLSGDDLSRKDDDNEYENVDKYEYDENGEFVKINGSPASAAGITTITPTQSNKPPPTDTPAPNSGPDTSICNSPVCIELLQNPEPSGTGPNWGDLPEHDIYDDGLPDPKKNNDPNLPDDH